MPSGSLYGQPDLPVEELWSVTRPEAPELLQPHWGFSTLPCLKAPLGRALFTFFILSNSHTIKSECSHGWVFAFACHQHDENRKISPSLVCSLCRRIKLGTYNAGPSCLETQCKQFQCTVPNTPFAKWCLVGSPCSMAWNAFSTELVLNGYTR